MKNVFKVAVTTILLLLTYSVDAQNGRIRGQIIDGENGEPLYSANAVLKGTQNGATTDFDGKFEIQAPAGTYELKISFIGLSSKTITGVEVRAGEVTVVDPVALEPASSELGTVTVTAEAVRNTEAAMVTLKKKSVNVMDGISAAKLRKTGDSDAGDAVKRVTGVSVEGGKYVYVRGLGDRYTKTMLNGIDIPGLDPDRNSIQIDIFPTSLISNMTVLKSSLAELPADFTGGMVNIETKAFPAKKIFQVSAGIGYNPSMHFNSDYIDYQGGGTDFLGFDDGTREIPDRAGFSPRPSFNPDGEVNQFVNKFNRTLGAETTTSPMDFDLGLTIGDQLTLKNDAKLGYIFSATYKNSTRLYDEIFFGDYQRSIPADEFDMIFTDIQQGILAEKSVLLGGLGGISYKTLKSKYKFTVMHLQNGVRRSAQLDILNSDDAPGESGFDAFSNNLEYNQRGLTNALLSGEHYIAGGDWQIDWKLSPTISTIRDPDIRKTAYTIQRGDSLFIAGAAGNPSRIWRYLNQINSVNKVDVTYNHRLLGEDAKMKFGGSYIYKTRDYEILRYDLQDGGDSPDYSGDPNDVLTDERIYPQGPLFYAGFRQPGFPNPNEYSSNVHYASLYASEEFRPLEKLKVIAGIRAELYRQRHTGRDQTSLTDPENGNILDNDLVLNSLDLFPSANVIYELTEDMNLRGSYFRSIARPSFKELSFANILDPVSNRTFNGGLFEYQGWDGNLGSTRINNFDLRWELFMNPGELISDSVFYKKFRDPIELVRIPVAPNSNDFQPRNVGDGTLYGVEFEIRKNLKFISPFLEKVSFSGNFTFTESRIDMTEAEFLARKGAEKEGQTIDDTRQMAGQAPYIINGGFSYDDNEKGWSSGIFYNVKGRTLEVVGGQSVPDVYTEPFHSLNFTLNKSFGEDKRSAIDFKITNILNDLRESFYSAYRAQEEIFTRRDPGVAFSVGYSYNF